MLACIYPGQGSQAVGMGKYLFEEFQEARETFEEASDALNTDVKKLCFEGPESDLTLTENTQPALLTTSIATHRVLKNKLGLKPALAAGHSIGEYAAVVGAGVLPFAEAVKAVRLRGQFMQSAVPVGQGGMIACLGLDDDQIRWLCEWTEKESGFSPVNPANFNSPGQVVISGSAKALDWLKTNFKAELVPGSPRRAKLIPLNVSAPFHCEMMKPAEEKMRLTLTRISFQKANYPVIQNFTAEAVSEAEALRENLVRQVSAPVLWTQCVLKMKAMGATHMLECGHGQVLKGLVKKIDESLKVYSFNSLEDLKIFEWDLKAMGH